MPDLSSSWDIVRGVLTDTEQRLLVHAFGGRRLRIPPNFDRASQEIDSLAHLIGDELTEKLCQHFPAARLTIPSSKVLHRKRRHFLLRRLAKHGASMATLCEVFDYSEREVRRIIRGK